MPGTNKRLCILFAGNSGAGKDTAADMLATEGRSRELSVEEESLGKVDR